MIQTAARMKIIFAGSGIFGLPTLRGLVEAGHEIAAGGAPAGRPGGRGEEMEGDPAGGGGGDIGAVGSGDRGIGDGGGTARSAGGGWWAAGPARAARVERGAGAGAGAG